MQVKRNTECSIKLPFVINIFVLSIFEGLLKTGFTVAFSFSEVALLMGESLGNSMNNLCSFTT